MGYINVRSPIFHEHLVLFITVENYYGQKMIDGDRTYQKGFAVQLEKRSKKLFMLFPAHLLDPVLENLLDKRFLPIHIYARLCIL